MYLGSDPTVLQSLSTKVLQDQAVAAVKCPQLLEEYKYIANDIAYEMSSPDSTMASTLSQQLSKLNEYCAKGATSVSAKSPSGTKTTIPQTPQFPVVARAGFPIAAIIGVAAVVAIILLKK